MTAEEAAANLAQKAEVFAATTKRIAGMVKERQIPMEAFGLSLEVSQLGNAVTQWDNALERLRQGKD